MQEVYIHANILPMGSGRGKSRRVKGVSWFSDDSDWRERVAETVGDESKYPLIADLLHGPSTISLDELGPNAIVPLDANESAEIHACLELARDHIPDDMLSGYADKFDAMLASTAGDGLDLTAELADEISELFRLGLSFTPAFTEKDWERLRAGLRLLGFTR